MKYQKYSIVGIISLILTFITLSAFAQTIIYVDANVSDNSNDGSSWINAKKWLQSALTIASSGDEIRVAEGNYYPTEGTFQLVNGVAIYGGYPNGGGTRNVSANETILNGDLDLSGDKNDNDASHVVTGANDAILDGFTITNGNAYGSGSASLGGGLYFNHTGENTIINNCTISNNYAEDGAGIHNTTSEPTITNCTFSNNTASDEGGGIFNVTSNPTITNCYFSNNTAIEEGGGIMNSNSDPTIINCYFSTNSTEDCGGGIHNANSDPNITNCIFFNNSADVDGGGICNKSTATPIVINCTFSNNNATGNGDGIANRYSSDLTVKNCIFWGSNDQVYNENSSITVTFSDVQQSSGTYSGTGNINSDPKFQDVDNENFLLLVCSPCLGTGSAPDAANVPTTDKDGRSRPLPTSASQVDMGAYEQFDSDASLPVELSSFTAIANYRQVSLKWITESEVDNMGFHVYRSLDEHGTYERISSELIAGAGNSSTKQTYSFIDRNVVNGITYWYKLEDISIYGTSTMHGPISVKPSLEEPSELLPDTYSLGQNYPNPFNPATTIPFDLPEKGDVKLVLINIRGKVTKEITRGEYSAGHHEVELDASNLTTGIYFYKIEANDFIDIKKLAVVK